MHEFAIKTNTKNQLIDITSFVSQAVRDSGVASGIAVIYTPHTTAAVTINENADPDVQRDIISGLCEIIRDFPFFRHTEGNSDAHIKSSLVGASETVIIDKGRLVLGTWQGIYFCEFDGPRTRRYYIKIQ